LEEALSNLKHYQLVNELDLSKLAYLKDLSENHIFEMYLPALIGDNKNNFPL
jgi:hypothetical protein